MARLRPLESPIGKIGIVGGASIRRVAAITRAGGEELAAGLGAFANDQLKKAAVQSEEAAIRDAQNISARDANGQLIPEMPKGTSPNSIYSKTFNAAMEAKYSASLMTDMDKGLRELALEHRFDPELFSTAASEFVKTTAQGAPQELRGVTGESGLRFANELHAGIDKTRADMEIRDAVGVVNNNIKRITTTILHDVGLGRDVADGVAKMTGLLAEAVASDLMDQSDAVARLQEIGYRVISGKQIRRMESLSTDEMRVVNEALATGTADKNWESLVTAGKIGPDVAELSEAERKQLSTTASVIINMNVVRESAIATANTETLKIQISSTQAIMRLNAENGVPPDVNNLNQLTLLQQNDPNAVVKFLAALRKIRKDRQGRIDNDALSSYQLQEVGRRIGGDAPLPPDPQALLGQTVEGQRQMWEAYRINLDAYNDGQTKYDAPMKHLIRTITRGGIGDQTPGIAVRVQDQLDGLTAISWLALVEERQSIYSEFNIDEPGPQGLGGGFAKIARTPTAFIDEPVERQIALLDPYLKHGFIADDALQLLRRAASPGENGSALDINRIDAAMKLYDHILTGNAGQAVDVAIKGAETFYQVIHPFWVDGASQSDLLNAVTRFHENVSKGGTGREGFNSDPSGALRLPSGSSFADQSEVIQGLGVQAFNSRLTKGVYRDVLGLARIGGAKRRGEVPLAMMTEFEARLRRMLLYTDPRHTSSAVRRVVGEMQSPVGPRSGAPASNWGVSAVGFTAGNTNPRKLQWMQHAPENSFPVRGTKDSDGNSIPEDAWVLSKIREWGDEALLAEEVLVADTTPDDQPGRRVGELGENPYRVTFAGLRQDANGQKYPIYNLHSMDVNGAWQMLATNVDFKEDYDAIQDKRDSSSIEMDALIAERENRNALARAVVKASGAQHIFMPGELPTIDQDFLDPPGSEVVRLR